MNHFTATITLVLLALASSPLSAEQFGLFTYEVRPDNTVVITDYPQDAAGEVVIPGEIEGRPVTSIGVQAFSLCSGLTSVTIPEGVTTIGDYAFSDCSGLTSISIPEGVAEIGNGTFKGCSGLTTVTIHAGVTIIRSSAFFGCSGLTSVSIPEGVTTIGDSAFRYCSGLTSVSIPVGVTYISSGAFSGCSGLTSVAIPASVTTIGYGAFSGCSGLRSIEVDALNPNYISLDGVLFNKRRTSLIRYPAGRSGAYPIPGSVTSIGRGAFSGCSGLTSVSIPEGVTTIYDGTFSDCTGLTSLTIPEGVTTIGDFAFRYCSGLTSVTIPEGVTSIGSWAFSDCSSLASVSIPKSVTSLAWSSFENCPNLAALDVQPGNSRYASHDGVLLDAAMTGVRWCPRGKPGTFSIPNGVSYIGGSAFAGCSKLTSITLPDTLVTIFQSAFAGCSALTSITLPASVTEIVEWSSTPEIGSPSYYAGVFADCTSLLDIEVAALNPHFSSLAGVLFNADRTQLIQYPAGRTGPYSIPAGTAFIGRYAFADATHVTAVTVPASVTRIDHPFGTSMVFLGDSPRFGKCASRVETTTIRVEGTPPIPRVHDGRLSIRFDPSYRGFAWGVETSPDLVNWTSTWATEDFIISEPDAEGYVTASVPIDAPSRFLRLVPYITNEDPGCTEEG